MLVENKQVGMYYRSEHVGAAALALTHLGQIIVHRNDFRYQHRRRTEFSQIIPKKATVVAEMSTLNQKGCFLMNFK